MNIWFNKIQSSLVYHHPHSDSSEKHLNIGILKHQVLKIGPYVFIGLFPYAVLMSLLFIDYIRGAHSENSRDKGGLGKYKPRVQSDSAIWVGLEKWNSCLLGYGRPHFIFT